MIELLSGQNALYLMIAVAGFWFTVRFVVAPKRGAPGLGAMFRREAATPAIGLGREAIASLLADARQFAIHEPGIRGLLLTGAYAAKAGEPKSPVVLVALAEAPDLYKDTDWLARWAYLKRGHEVLSQEVSEDNGFVEHRLKLRGAPPVLFYFIGLHETSLPGALDDAFDEGVTVIDDPAGVAARFRQTVLTRPSAQA